MSEDKPTVCISCEPRDEAAAQRVASALREAGIEVVLSTEGGSAAVDGCDLFLPIVSDNTQTQSAGRFRTEWQRAAQRAEAMADDTTFLLPVVVDNTANREAKVPSVFRGRPWLRFEVWGSVTPLVSRVTAMLERRTAAQAEAQAEQQAQAEKLARSWVRRWLKRLPPWVRRLRVVWVITLVVLPGGVVVFRLQQSARPSAPDATAAEVPVVPVEPSAPADRARESAPGAAATGVDPRVTGQRDDAPRPAGAVAYLNEGYNGTTSSRASPETGSITVGGSGAPAAWQPQPVVRRTAGPRWAAGERERTVQAVRADLFAPRETAVAETTPGERDALPTGHAAGAAGPLAASPGETAEETRSAATPPEALVREVLEALWQGAPERMRTELGELEEDWLDTPAFTGPVCLLTGLAWQVQREVPEAAQRAREAWLQALVQVRARRAERPDEVELALVEAQVRVLLGQEVAALDALREFDDSVVGRAAGPQREHLVVWATLGDVSAVMNEALARFRAGKARWAEVRDWLRYDPRFAAWREAVAARLDTP